MSELNKSFHDRTSLIDTLYIPAPVPRLQTKVGYNTAAVLTKKGEETIFETQRAVHFSKELVD